MVDNDNDYPLLEEGRQKYIQAHKCLNNYLQSGIVSDDSIKYFTLNIVKKIIQTPIGILRKNEEN